MIAKRVDTRRYRKAPDGVRMIKVRCLSIMQEHEHTFMRLEHDRANRKCAQCRELEAARAMPAIHYCKINRER